MNKEFTFEISQPQFIDILNRILLEFDVDIWRRPWVAELKSRLGLKIKNGSTSKKAVYIFDTKEQLLLFQLKYC